ncbi:50S ribosomal protein L18, partial [Oleiphilus sp. HI0073]
MSEKKVSRIRRAKKSRSKMKSLGETRLTIHRTPRHIYAQVIAPEGDKVLASASTVEKDLRGAKTGNSEAATKVGQL